MIELPDEIWRYIKEFVFNWKRIHKFKMSTAREHFINGMFGEIEHIHDSNFPPQQVYHCSWNAWNGNEFHPSLSQRVEYIWKHYQLTSITRDEKGGWIAGYGWEKKHAERKRHRL